MNFLYHIGIDVGGTKIEGALLDSNHSVLVRRRVHTPDTYDDILASILDLVADISPNQPHTIGVGAPGSMDTNGLVKNSNIQCTLRRPLARDISDILGAPIQMANDADCFALAECLLGSGVSHRVVFGVILGTGVGGGVVVDGHIWQGRTGMAGEWGHHILHPGGNLCWCGRSGCVETYISGPALTRRWLDMSGVPYDIPYIIDAKPPGYDTWKREFLADFALALSGVIHVLDPDAIILGGGLSNISFLYDEAVDAIHDMVLESGTPIMRNALGDSGGVIGAALLHGSHT